MYLCGGPKVLVGALVAAGRVGRVTAFLESSWSLSALAGFPLVGVILGAFGWRGPFVLITATLLPLACFMFVIFPTRAPSSSLAAAPAHVHGPAADPWDEKRSLVLANASAKVPDASPPHTNAEKCGATSVHFAADVTAPVDGAMNDPDHEMARNDDRSGGAESTSERRGSCAVRVNVTPAGSAPLSVIALVYAYAEQSGSTDACDDGRGNGKFAPAPEPSFQWKRTLTSARPTDHLEWNKLWMELLSVLRRRTSLFTCLFILVFGVAYTIFASAYGSWFHDV